MCSVCSVLSEIQVVLGLVLELSEGYILTPCSVCVCVCVFLWVVKQTIESWVRLSRFGTGHREACVCVFV